MTGAGAGEVAVVRMRQSGTLRTAPGGKWMGFTAVQHIRTDCLNFSWKAAVGPLGAIRVVDSLVGEIGAGSVSLFGAIPLARQSGDNALLRGELLRYLAELPWAPDALLANPHLRFDEADGKLDVAASLGTVKGIVHFDLNPDGTVASVFAVRPRQEGGRFVDTPWHGRFGDYRTIEGRRVPLTAEVGWTIDGICHAVWRGRIEHWTCEAGAAFSPP